MAITKSAFTHLANEQRLLEALTEKEREQLAALLRKLNLGLPPL